MDWFLVMLAFQGAKWLDADLKEWAIYAVEGEQTYEGQERLTGGGRDGPIADELEFGRCGAVSIRCDIVAHVFHAVGEELAFLQLEGNSVLEENVANASEVA